ncbi:aminoacyl-histidine dipeptidase [Lagierella sp.]|uniref:aminoacyl-histidine dipeptidase n=1 Tax=Lagierella sp. TaxID=2849657 RepID=UPI00261F4765|nr:aminoacyl-histidine dipeptidase [Lagierella sp.]
MLENYEPKEVLYWFEELTKIPRCSKHEEKVSEFVLNFAKERNLEAKRDKLYNVIIKKPATKGLEDTPTVILQGHMDMVCEKTEDSDHDFSKDPLKLKVEDGWLMADKTTLGADDGIAVAYCLALLDSKDIPHPNLEVLLTTQEELGMDGAAAVKQEDLEGKYLLNIDGEVEGDLLVGCAGAMTITSTRKLKFKQSNLDRTYSLVISGLTGGHSGQEIEKFRGNSIKLIARILQGIDNLELVSLEGGSKHNAIPSYSKAILLAEDKAKAEVEKRMSEISLEHKETDPNLKIELKEIEEKHETVWDEESQRHVLKALVAIPDGVIYMDYAFPGLVQTSISNGVLTQDESTLKLVALLRSSVLSSLVEIRNSYGIIMNEFKFDVTDDGGYPAWEYDPDSKLREVAIQVYEEMYHESPNVHTIHCGLECGILKKSLTKTDMITFGPQMYDIHTPKERIDLESVDRIWEYTKRLLLEISKIK